MTTQSNELRVVLGKDDRKRLNRFKKKENLDSDINAIHMLLKHYEQLLIENKELLVMLGLSRRRNMPSQRYAVNWNSPGIPTDVICTHRPRKWGLKKGARIRNGRRGGIR